MRSPCTMLSGKENTPLKADFPVPSCRFIPLWRQLFFCLALFAWSHAQAEPVSSAPTNSGRTAKLLILDSELGNPYDEVRKALLMRLAEHGYTAGKNLQVSLRVAGNDIKEGERILREEADKGWDAVFVGGTIATIAAKNTLLGRHDLPVVFGSPTDPVGIGVISDFNSKPTHNFTGVSYPVPITARLRFIRQLLPDARTLGLIYADMPQSISYNQWLRNTLAREPEFKDLTILFTAIPLVTGEDGDRKMAKMAMKAIRELDPQVDAFIKPNDQMGARRPFAEAVFANATKPLIGLVRDDVMNGWGATAVIYPSHDSIGEQSADMLRALFEGDKPAELVPQRPKKYGFAVDLNKTRRFGIRVPIEVLRLAGPNIVKLE